MKPMLKSTIPVVLLALAGLVLLSPTLASRTTAASSPSITISPTSGIVGTSIVVTGQGFPPQANLTLNWGTANVSWVLGGNPTEVTGISAVPTQEKLSSVQTDSSGSFSVTVTAPVDNGGKHVIQAFTSNGTALQGLSLFALEPSFNVSSVSGPAGSTVLVTAHGLGDGTYSTNYHVMWDNKYFGYMTAVTTHGEANFTFYAVGTVGVHYLDIYQGYPGPGYLNPGQNPSPGNWYPPYLPYQTIFTITSEPFTSSSGTSNTVSTSFLPPVLSLGLIIVGLVFILILAFQKNKKGLFGNGAMKFFAVVAIAGLLIAGGATFLLYNNYSAGSGSTLQTIGSYVPKVSVVRPQIIVPQNMPTSGPSISVSPNVATVGTTLNVTGTGFSPDSRLPVSWSTRQGNNLNGFTNVNEPLRNVVTSSSGSFSFTMKVPTDLEGYHFISVANLTQESNATLYIERSATISPSEGPQGTQITIQLLGTGWDFNTNIVAIDYDNAFVGYACGFNSQGNITVTIPAAGEPGIHTIDIYPSIYLGPSPPSTIAVFRYPLLTPYDHPEKAPSFHFSFLITSTNESTANVSQTSMINSFGTLIPLLVYSSAGSYAAVSMNSKKLVRAMRVSAAESSRN